MIKPCDIVFSFNRFLCYFLADTFNGDFKEIKCSKIFKSVTKNLKRNTHYKHI